MSCHSESLQLSRSAGRPLGYSCLFRLPSPITRMPVKCKREQVRHLDMVMTCRGETPCLSACLVHALKAMSDRRTSQVRNAMMQRKLSLPIKGGSKRRKATSAAT